MNLEINEEDNDSVELCSCGNNATTSVNKISMCHICANREYRDYSISGRQDRHKSKKIGKFKERYER